MDPAVVADIQYIEEPSELREMFSPINLDKAELILMPVNNNQDPTSESKEFYSFSLNIDGGTHWALLIYLNGTWYYLDSSAGESSMIINTAALMQNMKTIMGKGSDH